MNGDQIPRRTLLECATRLASTAIGLQFFTAWTKAAQQHEHAAHREAPAEPDFLANYSPRFFSAPDFAALQSFTELLIPTDETPGAREAHCAAFIDFVLSASNEAAPATQKQWRSAMTALRDAGFHAADVPGRAALLKEISRPEIDHTATHPAFTAYILIKRESVFAFYTARAGMIGDLDYRGNSYNIQFPACTHPEHHTI